MVKNTRRPTRNFINQLTDDTNLDKEDLETVMSDREYRKIKVIEVRHDDDEYLANKRTSSLFEIFHKN